VLCSANLLCDGATRMSTSCRARLAAERALQCTSQLADWRNSIQTTLSLSCVRIFQLSSFRRTVVRHHSRHCIDLLVYEIGIHSTVLSRIACTRRIAGLKISFPFEHRAVLRKHRRIYSVSSALFLFQPPRQTQSCDCSSHTRGPFLGSLSLRAG